MEIHGAPLSRTWVKLGADVEPGSADVTLSESVSGWRVGDEVIVTASSRGSRRRTFRNDPDSVNTEKRRIAEIAGRQVTLDQPLDKAHLGSGEFAARLPISRAT